MKKLLLIPVICFIILTMLANKHPNSDKTAAAIVNNKNSETVVSFENYELNKAPKGFSQAATGKLQKLNWKIVNDFGNKVAAQLADNSGNYYNLLILDNMVCTDFKMSVRIKAISGTEDQGGGLVWRYIDRNNYYIARFNPLENNLRLYRVANGYRKQLQSADSKIKTGQWFNMSIEMQGNRITCSLNGRKLIETSDDMFAEAGSIGLWTKADAKSYFDDLTFLIIK